MLSIVMLSREYPPETQWGGCSTANYNLARALARRGHKLQVICQAANAPHTYVDEGVVVHRVGTDPRRYSAVARLNYYFHAWTKLIQLRSKARIDIVQADHWSAEGLLPAISRTRTLVIATYSTLEDAAASQNYTSTPQLLQLKALAALANFTLRRADAVVCDSLANYRQIASRFRIPGSVIRAIPLATDTDVFRPVSTSIRAELGMDAETPFVLFVGRLEPRKGVYNLLKAMGTVARCLPMVRFVLVGQDTSLGPGGRSMRDHILAEARHGGFYRNLILVAPVPLARLVELYSGCDMFVLPSVRESFGFGVVEAMACSKPVVATATGIVPELGLADRSGVIVPVDDSAALAEGILSIAALAPEEREAAGRLNREQIVRQFSIPAYVQEWERAYGQALRRARKGGSVAQGSGNRP